MATPSAQEFANQLNAKFPGKKINDPNYPGADIGQQWLNYYAKYSPHYSLDVLEKGFLDVIALEEIKGGISQSVSATATATNQIAQGSAAGLEDFYKSFNLGSWFLRIAEILLGIVLVGVGIARLTGAQNVISKAVKAKIL